MHQRNKTRHLFCQIEVWTFLTVSLVGKECVVRPALLLSWRAAVTLPRLQQWTSGTWQPSQPAGDCPPGSQSDNCDLWTRWGIPVSLGCQWLRPAGPGDHGDYFYLLQRNPRQLQMEQPASPVQNVVSTTKSPFIKLYISLHNMFRYFVIPTKTTLYDDSLKNASDDKQMAAVRLLGENQIKKKDVWRSMQSDVLLILQTVITTPSESQE